MQEFQVSVDLYVHLLKEILSSQSCDPQVGLHSLACWVEFVKEKLSFTGADEEEIAEVERFLLVAEADLVVVGDWVSPDEEFVSFALEGVDGLGG